MPGDTHSSASTAARVIGRPWTKGQSGNPAGRARGIEARAREHTEKALQALLAALANPKERVAAASVLLSYGWGRPRQVIEANEATSVTIMHLIAATQVPADMAKELGITRALPEPRETVVDGTVVPTE